MLATGWKATRWMLELGEVEVEVGVEFKVEVEDEGQGAR